MIHRRRAGCRQFAHQPLRFRNDPAGLVLRRIGQHPFDLAALAPFELVEGIGGEQLFGEVDDLAGCAVLIMSLAHGVTFSCVGRASRRPVVVLSGRRDACPTLSSSQPRTRGCWRKLVKPRWTSTRTCPSWRLMISAI